jgi:hypothetical protein
MERETLTHRRDAQVWNPSVLAARLGAITFEMCFKGQVPWASLCVLSMHLAASVPTCTHARLLAEFRS